ncbi:MAG: ligase-associated DNA damage response exonuclease [Pseudomonadota bacterium]
MAQIPPHPASWLRVTDRGLHVVPGDLYVDPARSVDRAVITHGHADHARPGNRAVLATSETLAVMDARYGNDAAKSKQALGYGQSVDIGDVSVRLVPAGHVLGSAQVVLDYRGSRAVVSGDYKRGLDPTCTPFEPVSCDVFITEATFGLPVFRHPHAGDEVAKLLRSVGLFPDRAHLVGVYALGKCQRVIALLRQAGYDRPLYLHGALIALTELYGELGVELGEVRPVADLTKEELKGEIVLAPPSAIADRWSRRLPDPVVCAASGWMRVRQRARQRGVELPMIISDHADWDELLRTIDEVDAPEVWVTHGREEALVHQVTLSGRRAQALSLVGFEEDAAE